MRAVSVLVLAACGTPAKKQEPAPQPVVPADAARADARSLDAAIDAARVRHVVGALHAPSPAAKVWPWRVCIEGSELVFENDCGCNDALLCHVDSVAGAKVRVTLTTDPTRMPHCTDCFPMVPATCAVALGSTLALEINGLVALDGKVADGNCWAQKP